MVLRGSMGIFAQEWRVPELKWILHGNEYWHAEAESTKVRKEHGCRRKRRKRGNNTFRKVRGTASETVTSTAKQDGHLEGDCYKRKKKKDGGMNPPLHEGKSGRMGGLGAD